MSTFMLNLQHSKIHESFMKQHSSSAFENAGCDVIVLDARTRQALVTVRSLGSRGLRTAALETFKNVPAFSSRWCQQKIICSANEGTEEYLTLLERALDFTNARVIIPSSDGTIALIRQHRERLEKKVHIALAKESGLGIAVNKERTLEVARSLGLGVPEGILINDISEVRHALHEVGLPAVVKPTESWVSKEQQGIRIVAQLVTTPDEAYHTVEELT